MKALIADLKVEVNISVRAAFEHLDRTGKRILLLADAEDRLIRTVTNGDLRRFLLAGASMDDSLTGLPPVETKRILPTVSDHEALELMNLHHIDHLPVVDETGRLVDLRLRHEIDHPILLSTPHLGKEETLFVAEAFKSNWIAPLGPNVDAFEKEMAQHVGVAHAAALSSGTAAIHLGLRLLGVGAGDIVFCSSLTFVASANPIIYQGAVPVFIDSDFETWNMSPQALNQALQDAEHSGKLPKAVIVVNLYGQSADMDPILALCERYGVPVLEDAAESLGASYKQKASGTLGRIGIYSFNGNKIITTSGGGMLVSADEALVAKARFLATQARDPTGHYEHSQLGYNYRMSNVLAGVGRGQLRVLEERVASRRLVFERYKSGLSDCDVITWMPEAGFGRSTRWLTAGLLDARRTDITPIRLIELLARSGIEARRVWKPMHQQPLYSTCKYYPHPDGVSVSDHIFAHGVCLPSGSNMIEEQQYRVIRAIRDVIGT